MRNHNPKRFLLPAAAAIAMSAAAFLAPGVASADGPRPAPRGVFIGGGAQTGAVINGIWVPQGSPLIGTTYGGDGQQVVEREQLEAVRGLVASTYGRGN